MLHSVVWVTLWSSTVHAAVVQLLSCVQLFVTPWTAAHQASLSITSSRSLLKPMSIESVMPSNHLILCRPFSSCPQSFPTSGSFPVSCLLASGGQSIAALASVSVLPLNIQGWFPLGLIGLISLRQRDSQETSPTPQIQSIGSLVLSLLDISPTFSSIDDHSRNHSFD